MNAKERLSRIDKLLDKERAELKAGRYGALEALIGEREAHVQALEGSLDAKDSGAVGLLRGIQAKAERNARLIGAAREGFAAGSKRVAEIESVREKLSTYSENGQVSDIIKSKSSVQKTA